MKELLFHMRGAVLATLALGVVCCGIYPLAVWGIAQAVFPHEANGSLIAGNDGTTLGSELLGQNFTEAKYFHPRPSAAGDGYDAANSGGSNLAPTSKKLAELVRGRVADYRAENGLKEGEAVPADAATASGSGLDPHISLRNAELQLERVAKARGLTREKVREVIDENTAGRSFGVLGEPGVNVLRSNEGLDRLAVQR